MNNESVGSLKQWEPEARAARGRRGWGVCGREETRTSLSFSYPDLETVYRVYRVRVSVLGLPSTSFETYEEEKGGILQHRWVWQNSSPEDSASWAP